jgi:hypothetical protein
MKPIAALVAGLFVFGNASAQETDREVGIERGANVS